MKIRVDLLCKSPAGFPRSFGSAGAWRRRGGLATPKAACEGAEQERVSSWGLAMGAHRRPANPFWAAAGVIWPVDSWRGGVGARLSSSASTVSTHASEGGGGTGLASSTAKRQGGRAAPGKEGGGEWGKAQGIGIGSGLSSGAEDVSQEAGGPGRGTQHSSPTGAERRHGAPNRERDRERGQGKRQTNAFAGKEVRERIEACRSGFELRDMCGKDILKAATVTAALKRLQTLPYKIIEEQ